MRCPLVLVLSFVLLASSCDRESPPIELADAEKTEEVILGAQSRRSLSAALPSEHSFSLELPANAELVFSAALLSERERVPRARVRFRAELSLGSKAIEIYRREVQAGEENRWLDARVDLSAWSGKTVKVTLSAEPSSGASGSSLPPWASRVRPAWGDPRVRSREVASLGPGERPSFLVILVDTLRRDFLGAYGFEGPISPNLDRLAAESLLFDNCFSNAPWTKPSIATLFTSLPPAVHGVTGMGKASWSGEGGLMQVLPEEAETIAERFRAAGYRTAAFVANSFVSPRHGFSQGFEVFERKRMTEDLLASARGWLSAQGESREAPLFLYLHVMDVHGPYDAPREDFEAVLPLMERGIPRKLTESEYAQLPDYLRATDWAADEERYLLSSWRAKYGAGVHSFDRTVGPFLDELRASGVLDRAYVVLTSDHGEELLEHGGWNHGNNLYDHQLHVPLLVRRPLAEDAGRRIPSLVSLIDLMPTLLSAAGVEAPPGTLGRDLSPLFRGESLPEADAVFASAVNGYPDVQGVRTLSRKLIWDQAKGEFELYDLGTDPRESRDLSEPEEEDVSSAGSLARLKAMLREQLVRNEARGLLTPRVIPMDDELRERLKALGYVP